MTKTKIGEFEEAIPDAARMIGNLRDLDYTFETAIADLIDNSITANAHNVEIIVNFEGANSSVVVLDDGSGMTDEIHKDAMRLGSITRSYGSSDLGKYGLGLKLASISQGKKLTVATKSNESPEILVRRIDVDEILVSNSWKHVKKLDPNILPENVIAALSKGTGTAVIIENLDRVFLVNDPSGDYINKRLLELVENTERHLAMVFHRYLDPTFIGVNKVSMKICGNRIQAWDPFCKSEPGTVSLEESQIDFKGNIIYWKSYVVPSKREFSNDGAWSLAGGIKGWNEQQGFYLYRANRLISSGGWLGLRKRDEHTKLARVSLDFPSDLDEEFKLNISKMKIQLPSALKKQIEPLMLQVIREADQRYRTSASKSKPPTGKVTKTDAPQIPPVNKFDESNDESPSAEESGKQPIIKSDEPDISSALVEVASKIGLIQELNQIKDHLVQQYPVLAKKIGWE
jgi:hypothetical protein